MIYPDCNLSWVFDLQAEDGELTLDQFTVQLMEICRALELRFGGSVKAIIGGGWEGQEDVYS